MKTNLRSDSALRRAIEELNSSFGYLTFEVKPRDIVIKFWDGKGKGAIAELSVRDHISKRKSLPGVNARLKAALRPKKKVSRKRK